MSAILWDYCMPHCRRNSLKYRARWSSPLLGFAQSTLLLRFFRRLQKLIICLGLNLRIIAPNKRAFEGSGRRIAPIGEGVSGNFRRKRTKNVREKRFPSGMGWRRGTTVSTRTYNKYLTTLGKMKGRVAKNKYNIFLQNTSWFSVSLKCWVFTEFTFQHSELWGSFERNLQSSRLKFL